MNELVAYLDIALSILGLAILAGGLVLAGRGNTKAGMILLGASAIVEMIACGDLAAMEVHTDFADLVVTGVTLLFEQGPIKEALRGSIFAFIGLMGVLFLITALITPSDEEGSNRSISKMIFVRRD